MMRWSVLLLSLLLSGCAQPPDDGPAVIVIAPNDASEDVVLYGFTLYGKDVSESRPDVTFRIFVDGRIGSFVEWAADAHTSTYDEVQEFQVGSPTIAFDIVYEGERVSGGSIDLSECPDRTGDAFVRVMDMYRAHTDYGCHVDGYTPDA